MYSLLQKFWVFCGYIPKAVRHWDIYWFTLKISPPRKWRYIRERIRILHLSFTQDFRLPNNIIFSLKNDHFVFTLKESENVSPSRHCMLLTNQSVIWAGLEVLSFLVWLLWSRVMSLWTLLYFLIYSLIRHVATRYFCAYSWSSLAIN